MKNDFSPELKKILEDYAKENDIDMSFECKKLLKDYHITIIDSYGHSEEKVIEERIVSDFLQHDNLKSKNSILSIIFNPGPRISPSAD